MLRVRGQFEGLAVQQQFASRRENVLTELHAVTIRDGLAFPNYFTTWEDGRPLAPDSSDYAGTLLDLLAWWATALRSARHAAPFPA